VATAAAIRAGTPRIGAMSLRAGILLAVLLVADAVALGLTIHTHLDYHPSGGSPSVMTLGQLLGWLVSVVLLLILVTMIAAQLRAGRERRRKKVVGSPNDASSTAHRA
jgi:hypothetical protein